MRKATTVKREVEFVKKALCMNPEDIEELRRRQELQALLREHDGLPTEDLDLKSLVLEIYNPDGSLKPEYEVMWINAHPRRFREQ